MYKQGVVLELRKKEAVVFNQFGGYEKIKRKDGMVVGQVVEYQKTVNTKLMVSAVSAAAILMVMFFSFSILQYINPKIFAYVTLDINPSMEFSIDNENSVIKLKALNSDAEKITKVVSVRGKNIDTAIAEVLNEISKTSFIGHKEDNVVVLSTSASDLWSKEDELNRRLNETSILVEKTVRKFTKNYVVVETIPATPEMRKQSIEADMSIGRYALYTKAIEEGYKISLQDAKTAPLTQLIGYTRTAEGDFNKVDNVQNNSNDINRSSSATSKNDYDKNIKDLEVPQKSSTDSKVESVNNESLPNKKEEVKTSILDSMLIESENEGIIPKESPTVLQYDEIYKFAPSPTAYNDNEKISSTSDLSKPKHEEESVTPTPGIHISRHDEMPDVSPGISIPKYDDDRPKITPGPNKPEIEELIKDRQGNTMPNHNDKIPRPEIEGKMPEHLEGKRIGLPEINETEQLPAKPFPNIVPDSTEVEQTPVPYYSEPEATFGDNDPYRNREFNRKRTGNDIEFSR